MIKACAINHQRLSRGYHIGNNWYSNAMAAGGEAFQYSPDVVDKIVKAGYKISFFCWGRKSLANRANLVSLFKACHAKKVLPLIQQVHNLSAYSAAQLKEFGEIIDTYAPLISPVRSFVNTMKHYARRVYYFPNAVDGAWISKMRTDQRENLIISDTYSEQDLAMFQCVLKAHDGFSVNAFSRVSKKTLRVGNIIINKSVPQAAFYKRLSKAKVAVSLSSVDSFGRFAIECAFLGVPLLHLGSKETACNLFPALASTRANMPLFTRNLISDPSTGLKAVEHAVKAASFYDLPAWRQRYEGLLSELCL